MNNDYSLVEGFWVENKGEIFWYSLKKEFNDSLPTWPAASIEVIRSLEGGLFRQNY